MCKRAPIRMYGCPFAHLLSACTCYNLQNFNDKNVAAHLKIEPHMSNSRRRKSFVLRNYDISAQFCAARVSLMAALLISRISQIFFNIPPHIFWMPVYTYGCPFAHLLSAHTCFSLKNFVNIIIAAHLKFEPNLWVSRLRKSILLRNYDVSPWFCAAHLRVMGAFLISKNLLVSFNIPLYIFWIPVYPCRCPPFVGIVAKVAERHKAASPFHVTTKAQISYPARAETAGQAEYFTDVRSTPQ